MVEHSLGLGGVWVFFSLEEERSNRNTFRLSHVRPQVAVYLAYTQGQLGVHKGLAPSVNTLPVHTRRVSLGLCIDFLACQDSYLITLCLQHNLQTGRATAFKETLVGSWK